MSKSALGKGLGNLLSEMKPPSPPPEVAEKPASISPGMAALLRGNNGEAKGECPAVPPPIPAPPAARSASTVVRPVRRRLQVSLFLADVLLLAFAIWLAVKAAGRFGWLEVLLSVVAVSAGAWLSCLALWLEKPQSAAGD